MHVCGTLQVLSYCETYGANGGTGGDAVKGAGGGAALARLAAALGLVRDARVTLLALVDLAVATETAYRGKYAHTSYIHKCGRHTGHALTDAHTHGT